MIAFVADWKSGEIRVDPLEIEAAQWFKIRDLPQLPNPISISRRLIDAVVAEMQDRIDDASGSQGCARGLRPPWRPWFRCALLVGEMLACLRARYTASRVVSRRLGYMPIGRIAHRCESVPLQGGRAVPD